MSINYGKIAVGTLKVLAVIGAASLAALGVGKIVIGNKKNSSPAPQQPSQFTETSKKIVDGLRITQVAVGNTLGVIGGLAGVVSSVNQLFDRESYNRMLSDPSATTGYFGNSMIPSFMDQSGVPYGQGVDRGETQWIRTSNNVINVW